MNIYIQLLLVAAIVIYIVDLSGFTDSWRSAMAKALHISDRALKPLPPFDCSKCMTWWTTIIYSICGGSCTLTVIAYCAMLSMLSYPMAQLLTLIRETVLAVINKFMSWL